MKPEVSREIEKIKKLSEDIIELIRKNKSSEANDKCEDIHNLIELLVLNKQDKANFRKELEEISKNLAVIFQASKTLEAEATTTLKTFLFHDQTYNEEDIE